MRLREILALILIALLPFHALLVTAGTLLLFGPNHAPWPMLALWKEALLGVVLLLAAGEWLRSSKAFWQSIDLLDMLITAFVAVSVFATFTVGHRDPPLFALGMRYDVIPLVSFVILRRVPWSPVVLRRALTLVFRVGIIIALYGLLTLLLPDAWFRTLGYSLLHSLYVPDGPIAAFQYVGGLGVPRIQSVMSGPNQLGLWLLLPWTIVCIRALKSDSLRPAVSFPLLIIGAALLATFSRSAWVAGAVIAIVCLWHTRRGSPMRAAGISAIGIGVIIAVVGIAVQPELVLRAASSRDHLTRPLAAVQSIVAHPLGQGLGAAGPASNRVRDVCVFLKEGDDALWAQVHPQLCVFVGGVQIQPSDRTCACPFLPENWYLQIGVEAGIIGMILFLWLTGATIIALRRRSMTFFLAFLGVSIAALFLHAWEDSALAYAVWVLLAAVLPASFSAIATTGYRGPSAGGPAAR